MTEVGQQQARYRFVMLILRLLIFELVLRSARTS